MIPIKNLDDYTEKMSSAIKDKLFFVNKIYGNVYIDYGCADGALLRYLDNINNDKYYVYIGYDHSEQMINLAKSRWNGIGKVCFTSNFDEVTKLMISYKGWRQVLILSSVLHEIISQGNNQNKFFEDLINNIQLRYIVIRDMAFNPIIENVNIENYLISKVECKYPQFSKEFTDKYGKLSYGINFCHFLLKYQYVQNWQRELEENYFAFNPDQLIKQINNFNYIPIYLERFNVDFIRNKIYKDLGIDINTIGETHIKMIFKKYD